MPRVHSHYDNLKIPRDATPDEIRVAYRNLTRRHHPDRRPGDADAERVMAIVNVAYSVLSEPHRRREHDAWLEAAEADAGSAAVPRRVSRRTTPHVPVPPASRGAGAAPPGRRERSDGPPLPTIGRLRLARRLVVGVVAGSVVLLGAFELVDRMAVFGGRPIAVRIGSGVEAKAAAAVDAARSARMPAEPAAPRWAASPVAPNGQAWPAAPAYVDDYPRLNESGESVVVADNRANRAAMFVKLFALDGPQPQPVRTFFVTPGGSFRLGKVSSGTYDLRYRDLDTGLLTRSSPFILEEVTTPTGNQHSSLAIRLDAAGRGSPLAFTLTEAEF